MNNNSADIAETELITVVILISKLLMTMIIISHQCRYCFCHLLIYVALLYHICDTITVIFMLFLLVMKILSPHHFNR